MRIRFALICEGSSDAALVHPLERLCSELGVDEVAGEWIEFGRLTSPPGKKLEDQLHCLVSRLGSTHHIVFVHRDANGAGRDARLSEISAAVAAVPGLPPVVAVVPSRETEAWLLADTQRIRQLVGRPGGSEPLGLPRTPDAIEALADPKRALGDALARASCQQGTRLAKVKKRFSAHRAMLLEQLDLAGPVQGMDSWKHLCSDLERALKRLRTEPINDPS